jgi:Uma2 family endonuclease
MSTLVEMIEEGPPPILEAEHYEIINGVCVETPRMGVYETWIASFLFEKMIPIARGLGRVVVEAMFNLDPEGNNRRPDLAFVSYNRWPRTRRVPKAAAWNVVPDLAVEVVSPSNRAAEIVTKTEEYFRAGVRLVWVIFPEEQLVQVWDSPSACRVVRVGQSLEGGEVIPGFQLSLAELFEEGIEATD